MPVINRIAAIHDDMTAWRRDIHAHPELGFQEERTSAVVAEKLESFGIQVHRGLAKTGVVGILEGAPGEGAIALRADMDALPILEANDVDHRSTNDGAMHACGHDGHTTMLLGAAQYLAETRNFAGTVYFVFQPAEEGLGGGEAMVNEGLFEHFPASAVYGMHNWPGLPPGEIAVRTGPMMAACDEFTITVEGTGAHGAMPHLGHDSGGGGGADRHRPAVHRGPQRGPAGGRRRQRDHDPRRGRLQRHPADQWSSAAPSAPSSPRSGT